MVKKAKREKKANRAKDVVTREYTIHVAKLVHKVQFKKKAPRVIKSIKAFARKVMGTKDNRVETNLNKFIWSKGIRYTPKRVRVQLQRKRNEDEDAKNKLYTLISYVPVTSFKGLQTVNVKEEEQKD